MGDCYPKQFCGIASEQIYQMENSIRIIAYITFKVMLEIMIVYLIPDVQY